MRILIAEDDVVSRHLLETTLAKWGYEVITTTDGLQALDVLSQPDAPSLAVLDWMMPGMDGAEVCRRARSLGADRLLYIILLTAKGQEFDRQRGQEVGADLYMTKPFDPDALVAKARSVLGLS